MAQRPICPERRAALMALAALATASAASPASAQPYPTRPVNIIVPYSPGGTTDIVARLLGHALAGVTGRNFVIENKGGGSTTIATGYVAKAAADGYTLLANEMTQTIIPSLFPRLPFDPVDDLVAATIFAEAPYVLVVNSEVPARNLRELVELAKSRPGKLNYASGGVGSGPHIAGELFRSVTGIDMTHIAYKGSGPAVADLLGGQVQVLITAAPTVTAQAASGRMRALAVAHDKRLATLPDLPTSAEAGYEAFRIANWFGLAAPKGTPAPVIDYLNAEVGKALAQSAFREGLVGAGAEPVSMTPAQAQDFIQAEARRWSELIRTAGIKAE